MLKDNIYFPTWACLKLEAFAKHIGHLIAGNRPVPVSVQF